MKKKGALKELEKELEDLDLDLVDPRSDSITNGLKISSEKIFSLNKLADQVIKENRKRIDDFEFPGVRESELLTLMELFKRHNSLVGIGKDLMEINGKLNGYLSFYIAFKRVLLEQFDAGILLIKAKKTNVFGKRSEDVLNGITDLASSVIVFKNIAKKVKRSKSRNFGDALGLSSDDLKALKIAGMIILHEVGDKLIVGDDTILPNNFEKSVLLVKDKIPFLDKISDLFDFSDEIGKDGALFGALTMIISRASVSWSIEEQTTKQGGKHEVSN